MKKIAIIGSRGYVGLNLSSILLDFEIECFSHISHFFYSHPNINSPKQAYHISSIRGNVNQFDLIIFLLESNAPKERVKIKDLFSDILTEAKETKIILLSTLSIYSSNETSYAYFKRELENLALSNHRAFIIRSGVIYGGIPGGLYKHFLSLRRKSFLLIPCSDANTGYISIHSIAKIISDIALGSTQKIFVAIDISMLFKDAITFFGFRGIAIQISKFWISAAFKPFYSVIKFFPRSLQSIVALAGMPKNIPEAEFIPAQSLVFRKLLLRQFIKINRIKKLDYCIRGFIRQIIINNSHSALSNLLMEKNFLFYKRLYEIYSLCTKKSN